MKVSVLVKDLSVNLDTEVTLEENTPEEAHLPGPNLTHDEVSIEWLGECGAITVLHREYQEFLIIASDVKPKGTGWHKEDGYLLVWSFFDPTTEREYDADQCLYKLYESL